MTALPLAPSATPPPASRSLDTFRRGESGHVERLDLPASLASRLAGMGVGEGRLVEVISRGDPMIVRACGSTLALGKAAARGIELCACVAASCSTCDVREEASA